MLLPLASLLFFELFLRPGRLDFDEKAAGIYEHRVASARPETHVPAGLLVTTISHLNYQAGIIV